jgi:hypothetical protein
VFRRSSKSHTEPSPSDQELLARGPGAKGRPTPSRREAQAAARERAKAGMDEKTAQKVLRERRADSNAKVRAGMRSGDERYLPAKDQGPVKRFIRDFVDARISLAEFLLPLLLIIMVMQYSGNKQLLAFSNALWTTTIIVVVLDTLWLMIRLRRALREKFPEESTKGTTIYTLLRALQVRPLRQPKPKVKVGGSPKPPKAPKAPKTPKG